MSRGRIILVSSLMVMIASGCGSESYERKFDESLDRLTKAAPFAGFERVDLDEGRISVRLPQIFEPGRRFQLNSTHPRDNGRIAPNRLELFLHLLPEPRDFRLCCEAETRDNARGAMPYYCYVAAGPITRERASTLAADIRERLMAEFPEKTAAEWKNIDWRSVQIPTPTGGSIAWRKLVIVGMQPFRRVAPDATDALRNLTGRLELYLHQADGYYVLLGWRAHMAFVDQVQLSHLAEITAGTLVVK